MAKVLYEPEKNSEQESESARFQRAMKTILKVPKEDVVKIEKTAQAVKRETAKENL